MLKKFDIADGVLNESSKDVSQVMVYINPDAEEKNQLVSRFKLDEHTLSSALDPDEISRLEFEADHWALIVKRPKNYSSEDQYLFKVSSLGMFMFRETLILVCTDQFQMFEGKQFQHVASLTDIALRLLYRTSWHFLEHLKVINMISAEIEQKINASMENKFLLHMFSLEKGLVYYLNALNSNAIVIEKMKNSAAKLGLTVENIEMVDDIVIENVQCLRQAEIYSNIITGLMDARGSIVNNNLNLLIKRLTMINIVFLPLNLIAGIGGMSEFSMMTRTMHWALSFGMLAICMVLLGLLTFRIVMKYTGEREALFSAKKTRMR